MIDTKRTQTLWSKFQRCACTTIIFTQESTDMEEHRKRSLFTGESSTQEQHRSSSDSPSADNCTGAGIGREGSLAPAEGFRAASSAGSTWFRWWCGVLYNSCTGGHASGIHSCVACVWKVLAGLEHRANLAFGVLTLPGPTLLTRLRTRNVMGPSLTDPFPCWTYHGLRYRFFRQNM